MSDERIDVVGEKCPRCDSPQPHLHPAVQVEGEVQPCSNPWHGSTRRGRETLERMLSSKSDSALGDESRVIAYAVKAGITEGHIEREARAMVACFGGCAWDRLSQRERDAYRSEAAGIAVGLLIASEGKR